MEVKGRFLSSSLRYKSTFGTITFDCESRVWVLKELYSSFIASYAFSYENAERNLLNAPFLVGSELAGRKTVKK
jgi:hypothetical protein